MMELKSVKKGGFGRGDDRLIVGMEMYYASPAESRLPVAPLVKCGGSWCLDVYH